MISTTIFPGRYVQGKGAMNRLGEEMARFGDKALVICSPFIYNNIWPCYQENIEKYIQLRVEKFGGECSDEEIGRLAEQVKDHKSEVVAGAGGGKTMDTAKAVAFQAGLPAAVVPTIASTDAPCSALAVIYTPEGAFKKYLKLRRNPDLVLVDTQVIANAPVRFLVSGMGDALATWFEAESCRTKYAGNMTGDAGSMAAWSLARLCYESILEYGMSAKLACQAQVVVPALEHVVEANILLSGLGFESGGLAAAHSIHDGLTVLEQTHRYYHGEKVAIGTLASLYLTDKPKELMNEVFSFCQSVGLPVSLSDIGLEEVTDQQLMKAAEAACAAEETIHNEPCPVTPEAVVHALRACDAEGRKRKSRHREFF
ncbi:MAG: glycerol dehydrogenase [Spirochaetota bacterium]